MTVANDPPAANGFIGEYRRSLRATGPAGRRFLLGAAVYLIRALGYSVAFPLFAKERGYSPSEIGVFIAASQFSLFLLGIPITVLGGRGHARRLLAIGPAIAAVGVVGLMFAPEGAVLPMVLFALLAGADGASFWVLGDPLLVATTPIAERTHVFALKFFLLTFGIVLGGGLGGWIPGGLELAGASKVDALLATMAFFALCDGLQTLVFASIPAYEVHHSPDATNPVTRPGRKGLPWGLMFALAVPEIGMALGHNGVRPFLSLFFSEAQDLSASTTGTVLAALGVVAGVGALFAPRIAVRLGSLPAIAILRAGGGLALMLSVVGLGFPAVFGLMSLYYFAVDGTEALLVAEAMNRVPAEHRTLFSGIYAMAWSVAATAASLLSGYIQDRQDGAFVTAFVVSAGGYLFSVLWLFAVFRRLPVLHGSERAIEPLVTVAETA